MQYGNGRFGLAILDYEIGEDFIDVEFKSGTIYKYDYEITGKENVEAMKQLAESGEGLTNFITKNVKDLYASKKFNINQ